MSIYIRMGFLSLDALWLMIIPIKFQRVSICSLISEKYVLLDNKHRPIGIIDHLIIMKSTSFRLRHLVLINGFKIVVHAYHCHRSKVDLFLWKKETFQRFNIFSPYDHFVPTLKPRYMKKGIIIFIIQ